MALEFNTDQLVSRIVRRNLTENSGTFSINPPGQLSTNEEGGWLGGITRFFTGLVKAAWNGVGWLCGKLFGALSFGISTIWGWCVQGYQALYNFNWNITDEQIDSQFFNMQIQLMSQLGGTAGNMFGWLACGIAPSAAIMCFNETLGLRLLKEVGEEALDEFLGNFENLLQTSVRMTTQWAMMNAFKGIRNWLKSAAKKPDSWAGKALENAGFTDDQIANWGEKGSKPWSFALAVEEWVDSIQNPFTQAFVEEFLEEMGESCIEAGYVVAGGLDRYILEQRMSRESTMGQTRIVEIIPNRESENERILLSGPETLIRQQIPAVLAQYQLIENRDIGQFTGEILRENVTKIKSPLTLMLQWGYFESPPFRQGNVSYMPQCQIPGIKRSKLDWENVKTAMGGNNGYEWGRFKASARLIDDMGNKTSPCFLFAGTASEAEDRLKALLTLSDYQIASFSVTEELKEGRKATGKALHKETRRIYPAYMTLINSQKVINEAEGRTELTGAYKRRKDRIEMWTSTKPDDFEAIIQELLSTPGANI